MGAAVMISVLGMRKSYLPLDRCGSIIYTYDIPLQLVGM